MYLIRDIWTAKPGQASRMAKLFKATMGETKSRVLTDVVGPYNTVIFETEVEKLADWEKNLEAMRNGTDTSMDKLDAKQKEEMSHYHEMFTEGRREIYRIE